jgi:bacterioferritin
MDRQELIELLNQDLRDEHVSVTRYLIHAYQAGEDTPLGSMMLSMAREEMWHMDWLADEIAEMGGEPDMRQGVYPHDPTSNATLLRSYIAWEEGLVKAYQAQAAKVDKEDVRRILMQQSKESGIHAQRFAAMLEKLGPEAEEPLVYEDTGEFSPELSRRLEDEMLDEYQLVLQHLRHAFVLEGESCPVGSGLELTAMRHMKHLSNFAEELAESGHKLEFVHPTIDMSDAVEPAIEADLALTRQARQRFIELSQSPELQEHAGLRTELDHMIYQEEFLAADLESLKGEAHEPEAKPAPEPPDAKPAGEFTVGSLMEKD